MTPLQGEFRTEIVVEIPWDLGCGKEHTMYFCTVLTVLIHSKGWLYYTLFCQICGRKGIVEPRSSTEKLSIWHISPFQTIFTWMYLDKVLYKVISHHQKKLSFYLFGQGDSSPNVYSSSQDMTLHRRHSLCMFRISSEILPSGSVCVCVHVCWGLTHGAETV